MMNVYFVRNDISADYDNISIQEIEDICNKHDYPIMLDVVPDSEDYGYIGSTYVNPDSSEPDLFNVFFTSNGKVCYMVQMNLVPCND